MGIRNRICSAIHLVGILILACFLSLILPDTLRAEITGTCVNCHTMHNSQGGSPMAMDDSGNPTATPHDALLIYSCLSCHTDSGSGTIVSSTPIINNLISPTNPLAGGNLYYIGAVNQVNGHNVAGVDSGDTTHGNTPPGGSALGQQLRCAGTDGCHGHNGKQGSDTPVSNQILAIKGGHHGDDTPPITGSLTDVADNYRLLLGITGKEDPSSPFWEQDNSTSSHNEYRGDSGFGVPDTISFLCGECHGNFHSVSGVGSGSPWLRHPTDYVLPATGEYASYTNYSMTAPVARPNPDSVGDTTQAYPGTDTLMCLSCHRAHASPYYKAVRWDYKSSTLTTAISGCNVCHTSKN